MTPRVTNQPRAAGDWTLGLTNQPRPQNLRVLLTNSAKKWNAGWNEDHEVIDVSRKEEESY